MEDQKATSLKKIRVKCRNIEQAKEIFGPSCAISISLCEYAART
jgi:hypothetical protein